MADGLRKGLTSYGDAGFSLFLRKAFIKAMGYSDDALSRPIVGITNTYSDYNPCHGNVPQIIEAVKRGVMGVVLIATLAFGLITPPYGLVLLMASKFVGVSFSKALRAALPIYVVFLLTITFTIYFPKVVLWLPKQVIPESVGCFKSPSGTGYICPN